MVGILNFFFVALKLVVNNWWLNTETVLQQDLFLAAAWQSELLIILELL